ncbi:hypothetical protein GQ457_10G020840 [Hibiscus cannabinus]
MLRRYAPSLPSPSLRRSVLNKQRSWSPDAERDEAWLRRKELYGRGLRRTQSFTADDIEELKGCIDLGFGFEPDSPELDPKLSQTLPALEFYCAINRQFNGGMSRSLSASSMDSLSDAGSTTSIIDQGDDPEMVKTRLRQWAQLALRPFKYKASICYKNGCCQKISYKSSDPLLAKEGQQHSMGCWQKKE